MDREERKRKFTEAIVNVLYPPPPEPDPDPDLEPVEAFVKKFGSDSISDTLDDNGNSSTSGDEQLEPETQKLTRAQRKNLRKKKLKEEATRRGKLIGPLLPLIPENLDHCGDQVSPAVRSNASEEDSAADESGVGVKPACDNTKKIKHRRKAKKLAKEKLNSTSTSQNCNRTATSTSGVDPKEER